MTILADYREDKTRLEMLLDYGLPLEIGELVYGDYAWLDTKQRAWGLEYKSGSDFLQSVASGRLHEQLAGMADTYDFPLLVVSTVFKPDRDETIWCDRIHHQWNYRSLEAMRIAFWVRGVLPITLHSESCFPLALKAYYELSQRGLEEAGTAFQKTQIVTFKDGLRGPLRVLANFDGIGEERARSLLEVYGSLENVFAQDVKGLMAVKGIGSKTASALLDEYRRNTTH